MWKEVKVSSVCSAQNGYAFKSKEFSCEGNYYVIKIKELKNGQVLITSDTDKTIYNEKYKKFEIHQGDILFALTGDPTNKQNPLSWVGRVSKYNNKEVSLLNQRVCKILFSDEIDKDYFYYYFRVFKNFRELASKARGSASQANISTYDILNSTIILPPLAIQKKISSTLLSLDKKIGVNYQICANLEAQAQALFKHWFIDFAPFKDGKFVESELGMIPEGWRVGRLGELIEIKYGKDHKKLQEGAIPAYGSAGLMRYVDSSLYKGESVLIPRKGTLNNVMLVNEAFWTVDTMFYTIPKYEHLLKYVFLKLSRIDFTKLNVGTSIPSNSTDQLNKMAIVIPPNNVLKTFDKLLNDIFVIKRHKIEESSRLSTLRDTLLPKLMSGEIKV